MITCITNKINLLSQQNYDEFLNNLNLTNLTCSCGHSGQLIKHAYYNRTIKVPEGPVMIRILRVICNYCKKTHALIPNCVIPYSQILLDDQLSILKAYQKKETFEPIMMANESIDESNIRYIIRQFLGYWKELTTTFCISLYQSNEGISYQCLNTLKRQFMQIKYIQNILSKTT